MHVVCVVSLVTAVSVGPSSSLKVDERKSRNDKFKGKNLFGAGNALKNKTNFVFLKKMIGG